MKKDFQEVVIFKILVVGADSGRQFFYNVVEVFFFVCIYWCELFIGFVALVKEIDVNMLVVDGHIVFYGIVFGVYKLPIFIGLQHIYIVAA